MLSYPFTFPKISGRLVRRLNHFVVEANVGGLPSFEDYRVVKEEPACGRHRFDLLLQHWQTGHSYYLEVKSCTLFEDRVAMFPDAITGRGTGHLHKLKEISNSTIKTGCLFAIMNPRAEGCSFFS